MSTADDRDADADLAAALGRAGRRVQPTAEQMSRWQRQLATDLARVRRRRRLVRVVGFAGAALAAVLTVVLLRPVAPSAPEPVVAQVAAAFGGAAVRRDDGRTDRLEVGDVVRAGQRVEVGRRGGLGLTIDGLDIRIDHDTVLELFVGGMALRGGRLYVDTGVAGGGAFRVRTPVGELEHTGTQYLVGVRDGEVLAAVREGSIVLHGRTGDVTLAAGSRGARSLVVTPQGIVTTQPVAGRGDLWEWAESVSAGLPLAGLSADAVLRWIARERGQRLAYATPQAEAAARASLAGSNRPVQAAQALDIIEAATSLRVQPGTRPDVMTVRLDSEADQHTD